MAKIRALRVLPGQDPVEVEIDDGLTSLQAEVGGYIELVRLEDGVDAFVNEEGILDGLPFNRVLPTQYHPVPVVGPVIVVGNDDEGETTGLTDEQVRVWKIRLSISAGVA